MKTILSTLILLVLATAASAQNSIKLFDPIAITASDYNMIVNSDPWGMYKSVQVYLSCPTSGRFTSSISGPSGGNLIIDNVLMLNDSNVCSGNCYGGLKADPASYLGMAIEMAYDGVRPVNVSRTIDTTGLYTFTLIDFGYTYGNSAVYLNTACSIIPIDTPPVDTPQPSGSTVCHRDNGNGGLRTLNVGPSAIAAHLSHGDTLGACGQ
ncbi:MAG: hypothetical protein ABI481_02515 [Pyrinomonadaceae bacterium]